MAYDTETNLIEILDDLEDFIQVTAVPVRFSNGKNISLERKVLEEIIADLRAHVPLDITRGKKILESEQNILENARVQAEHIKEEATLQAQKIMEEAMREASEAVEQDEITLIAKKRADEITAQADDYLKQAEEYAAKIVEKAQQEANEISLSALIYTQDTVEGLEDFIISFQEAQKKVFNQLFDGLQNDINDMDTNKRQVESQIDSLKRKMQ